MKHDAHSGQSHLVTAEWTQAMERKLGGLGQDQRGLLAVAGLASKAVVRLENWHKAWLCPKHRWKQKGADLQASLDKAGGNELPEGKGEEGLERL